MIMAFFHFGLKLRTVYKKPSFRMTELKVLPEKNRFLNGIEKKYLVLH